VLRNAPTGWQPRRLATGDVYVDNVEGLVVDDVTGDGRRDIVLAEQHRQYQPSPSVDVLSNTGSGFRLRTYLLPGEEYSPSGGVSTGDLDGDGRKDVVATVADNRPGSRAHVLRQTSTGTLKQGQVIPLLDCPEAVAIRDMNADRRPAVVMLHGGWNVAGILLQKSDPTLSTTEQRWQLPTGTFQMQQTLALDDVDSDGRPDITVASDNAGLLLLRQVAR